MGTTIHLLRWFKPQTKTILITPKFNYLKFKYPLPLGVVVVHFLLAFKPNGVLGRERQVGL